MNTTDKAQAETVVIAAVSGGVDSVVMLHKLLSIYKKEDIVVAHFDHGIRNDSAADARFVESLAGIYGLSFELGQGRLGQSASEDTARQARHKFLRDISKKHQAQLIATAHHHDDVVETAIINILRGTGRRGMSSLRETPDYARPLLHLTKKEIYDYALGQKLEWIEDETNQSDKYLRNRIRHHLVPKLKSSGEYQQLNQIINWFYANNPKINELVDSVLEQNSEKTEDHTALNLRIIDNSLVGSEVLVQILKNLKVQEIDKAEVDRLLSFAQSAKSGDHFNQFPPLDIIKTGQWLLFITGLADFN